jgi:hypothetical protein
MAMQQSKLAVDTRSGVDLRSAQRRQNRPTSQPPGQSVEKTDFFIEPKTGEVYDFIRFACTEPLRETLRTATSETPYRAKQERLDTWHTLQELAGII